jgi:hypothetical protein
MASKFGKAGLCVGIGVMCLLVLAIWYFSRTETALVPEFAEFLRIRQLPYDDETMNCTHKSELYIEALRKAGWTCKEVIGRVHGGRHTWVVFQDKKGHWRLVDPTGDDVIGPGFYEKRYKTYKPEVYLDVLTPPSNPE